MPIGQIPNTRRHCLVDNHHRDACCYFVVDTDKRRRKDLETILLGVETVSNLVPIETSVDPTEFLLVGTTMKKTRTTTVVLVVSCCPRRVVEGGAL